MSVEPTITLTDNTSCLSLITIRFNANTSAPLVEIQPALDSLLTFGPVSVAKTLHYGYWVDYQTLVVVFRECVPWKEMNTEEERMKKPLYVMFDSEEGEHCYMCCTTAIYTY